MVSDSLETDSSSEGAIMKDGVENLAIEQRTSVDCVASTILSTGEAEGGEKLSKKLLNFLSTQFRRSLSNMGLGINSNGHRGSMSVLNHDQVERKVMRVIERVRSCGYSEEVCEDLCNHFSRLPARYTSNIDAQRHEDILLHMNLLNSATEREATLSYYSSSTGVCAMPQLHARKVRLVSGASRFDTGGYGGHGVKKSIATARIPKPTLGSSSKLVDSPKVHPANTTRSQSTPLPVPKTLKVETSPNEAESIQTPTFGPFINPLKTEENSDQEYSYGYEITLATSDRHGLMKFFTNVLSNSPLQLNIREAHVFSTRDDMALEVFVVEGWTEGDDEGLRQAVTEVLKNRLNPRLTKSLQLQTTVEGLAYEDWTIDFDNLQIGKRLGGGGSGRLYKGKYLSQEVAIKVMQLDDANVGSESGALRTVPAAELLKMFKQEVSIMRLVRHKNLIQFIGACSKWPRLCIVTELMARGSVRDVLQRRRTGLDMPSAVKILRDAARGMDFLHQRGIVHRDLKAANLLIDEHDVVKLCDFGVARLNPATSSSVVGGDWTPEMTAECGTYRWMAPEVVEHKPYSHKADLYSFGILIWEVVTGEVPYSGLSPMQAAIGVVQRNLRPNMPSTAPAKLTALAEACWHQDPEQRPEFSEVVAILEGLVKPIAKKTLLGRMKSLANV